LKLIFKTTASHVEVKNLESRKILMLIKLSTWSYFKIRMQDVVII